MSRNKDLEKTRYVGCKAKYISSLSDSGIGRSLTQQLNWINRNMRLNIESDDKPSNYSIIYFIDFSDVSIAIFSVGKSNW